MTYRAYDTWGWLNKCSLNPQILSGTVKPCKKQERNQCEVMNREASLLELGQKPTAAGAGRHLGAAEPAPLHLAVTAHEYVTSLYFS